MYEIQTICPNGIYAEKRNFLKTQHLLHRLQYISYKSYKSNKSYKVVVHLKKVYGTKKVRPHDKNMKESYGDGGG